MPSLVGTLADKNPFLLETSQKPLGLSCRDGIRLGNAHRRQSSVKAQQTQKVALSRPIFPSGCEGTLGVALESLQGLRDLT